MLSLEMSTESAAVTLHNSGNFEPLAVPISSYVSAYGDSMPLGPLMCYFCLFTLELFPTLLAFERMKCPSMIIHRTFTCKQ